MKFDDQDQYQRDYNLEEEKKKKNTQTHLLETSVKGVGAEVLAGGAGVQ